MCLLLSFEASVDALPSISFEKVGMEYMPFPPVVAAALIFEALHPQPPPLAFFMTLGDNTTGLGYRVILGDCYCLNNC